MSEENVEIVRAMYRSWEAGTSPPEQPTSIRR